MTLMFSLLFPCQSDTESGFSTSGNTTVNPDSLTGSTDEGSTEGSNPTSLNPVVSGLDGSFVEDETGVVLEMHVYVEDPQGDILNGMLEVDYQWGDNTDSTQMDIDGGTVLIEEGEVTFFILDVDDTSTYEVFVTVYDEQRNSSEEVSAEILPAGSNEQ